MNKKITLLLFGFILLGKLSFAQTMTLTPNPIIKQEALQSDQFQEVIAKAILTNTGTTPQTIRWEAKLLSVPSAWDVSICDPTTCYLPGVTTNVAIPVGTGINAPITIAPGNNGNIDIHIFPKLLAGEGLIEITISPLNDIRTVLAKGTYKFCIGTNGPCLLPASAFDVNIPSISMFPNPVNDLMSFNLLEDVESYQIYDVLGRSIQQGNIVGNSIVTSSLSKGVYTIAFKGQEGELKANGRFVKD
jgi:hypothetical protein